MSIGVKMSQEETKAFKRSKNVPREVMRSQEESDILTCFNIF